MSDPAAPLSDEQLAEIRDYLEGCKGADLADVPKDLRRYEKWLMEADGRAVLLLAEMDRLRAALTVITSFCRCQGTDCAATVARAALAPAAPASEGGHHV